MIGDWVILTLAQARRLKRYLRDWGEYPRKGVHCGAGRHVPMPASWDGEGTMAAIGYSDFPGSVLRLGTEFATQITEEWKDIWRRHKAELTQAERDAVQALMTTAGPLPAEWDNAEIIYIEPEAQP